MTARNALFVWQHLVNGRNVQLLRVLQKLQYHGVPFLGAVLGVPYDHLFHIQLLLLRALPAFRCKRFGGMLFKEFLIIRQARAGFHEAFVILISKLIVRQDFVGIDVIEYVRVHLLGNNGRQDGRQDGQQAETRVTHNFIGVVRNSRETELLHSAGYIFYSSHLPLAEFAPYVNAPYVNSRMHIGSIVITCVLDRQDRTEGGPDPGGIN